MYCNDTTPRRGFLARVAAVTAGLSMTSFRSSVAAQGGPDDWIKEVRGTRRCLFDFPRHNNGWALDHIANYLNTYASAYKMTAGQVGAVGTFYGIGPGSSIALGFSDAIWAKYRLGEYHGLKDAAGKPYTRNVFLRPMPEDGHVIAQQIQLPNLPPIGEGFVECGIENLQKNGAKFILCNNALEAWTMELEARGKGKAEAIGQDLRGNLLPGVTIVPAMVIAIEQAQQAGIAYNRQ